MRTKLVPIAIASALAIASAAHAAPSAERLAKFMNRAARAGGAIKPADFQISKTPSKDLYEVTFDGHTFFSDKTGRYIMISDTSVDLVDIDALEKQIEGEEKLDAQRRGRR